MEQQQSKGIESTLDIDRVIQQLRNAAFGAKLVFKAQMSTHRHLDGQSAILLRPVIYPSDGDGGYDEEALPFFRVKFADGKVMDACESEIVTDDPAAEELIAGVCAVFAHARELDFVGPGHLEVEGTPDVGRAYIERLRQLPKTRADLRIALGLPT